MKIFFVTMFVLLLAVTLFPQTRVMIDDFDASASGVYEISTEGAPSHIYLSTNTTDKVQGTGALDVDAAIGAFHQWGSYAQLIYRTDSTDVQDWSIVGDSLSIWIKVRRAPTVPANMVFRIHLADRPGETDPVEEYIYENTTVIDNQHDWYQLKIPLIERDQPGADVPDSTGFILAPTTWGGFNYNNRTLDRDKIVGYNIGIITTGWDPNVNLPADSIIISLDGFERFGVRAVPMIIFNGITFMGNMSTFAWGQSSISVEEGAGPVPNTNAVKWVQGNEWSNGWSGIGLNVNPSFNLIGGWPTDSVKLTLKCEEGVGALRIQFEDGAAKVGTVFTPNADNQWHDYAFPLRDMVPQDGTSGFDPSIVAAVGLMAEASAVAGKVIYITNWWTGQPEFDAIPPNPPSNVSASTGAYQNVVLWDDVPGETGEKYDVYYSKDPITDVTAHGVEVVKLNVPENNSLIEHLLFAPNTNQNVTYYYAVICKDASGNKSVVSANSAPTTNEAKGVTTISLNVPAFVADGDLAEWQSITPFRMFPSDGSGHVVTNTSIDGDADLSVLSWIAVDNDNLYFAADVTDDIVVPSQNSTSYLNDCPDLFLGLYDFRGVPHTSLMRGAKPDYHFRFAYNRVLLDGISNADSITGLGANYYWGEKFPSGYIVEFKIPFTQLASYGSDDVFVPKEGYRIPIDYSVNDADATGEREGILTFSPFNEDQSWGDVTRWLYTWIGNLWEPTAVHEDGLLVKDYSLSQNYPNPFNPSTKIKFSIKVPGNVTLKIYDVLGREIATLINNEYQAGSYSIDFNASGLSSGIYFYRLESGSFVQTNKMMLLK